MLLDTDRGLHALERQYRIFGLMPPKCEKEKDKNEKIEATANSEVVFEVENLCFAYNESNVALDSLSFKIERGEIVAIVGLNGSGKTTLIKLLTQLFKPTSGVLKFCGRNYSEYAPFYINSKIGVFFQDYYLFHVPISENVGYGDIENVNNEHKIIDALKKGSALKVLDSLPLGINTFIGKQIEKTGSEFSGGERQRIAVSRAHMSNKEILIFDEPAAMLDPIAEMEQFQNIKEKTNGKTAILISHRVGFARLADRIIVLDTGHLVEEGTHEELMSLCGIYADFFNQQAMWYDSNAETIGDEYE